MKAIQERKSRKLLLRCDRITSIIVRYREGIGQALKVITDIRVCAVTNTQPHLEIEITINDMERIGPEYTFRLSQSIAHGEESKVSVSGKMAILTLGEENMRSFLRLRYDFGLIRAKWALGSDDELCELVHAMLKEISRYEEFIILDTASSELQADYGG